MAKALFLSVRHLAVERKFDSDIHDFFVFLDAFLDLILIWNIKILVSFYFSLYLVYMNMYTPETLRFI